MEWARPVYNIVSDAAITHGIQQRHSHGDLITGTDCRVSIIFVETISGNGKDGSDAMSRHKLDLREIPPPKRHPKIFEAFEELASGETLTLVNDHNPEPLYYQMAAEVESFDADGYSVDRVGSNEFVAVLPKK